VNKAGKAISFNWNQKYRATAIPTTKQCGKDHRTDAWSYQSLQAKATRREDYWKLKEKRNSFIWGPL
jgi:hypothetical protein